MERIEIFGKNREIKGGIKIGIVEKDEGRVEEKIKRDEIDGRGEMRNKKEKKLSR